MMAARHIYFTNRKEYYRRKKISANLKKYWSLVHKTETGLFRFSITFTNEYKRSVRAELITEDENDDRAFERLEAYVHKHKKLKKLIAHSEEQGLEKEQLGSNDIGSSKLETIRAYFT